MPEDGSGSPWPTPAPVAGAEGAGEVWVVLGGMDSAGRGQLLRRGIALARPLERSIAVVSFCAWEEGIEQIADASAIGGYELGTWGEAAAGTEALLRLISQGKPGIVLFADAAGPAEMAARVAARAGLPLCSRIIRIDEDENRRLMVVRPCYGDEASCTIVPRESISLVATVGLGARGGDAGGSASHGPVGRLGQIGESESGAILERIDLVSPEVLDPGDADMVVAGGRGVGGKDGFHLLARVASRLGAALGASRVAVDAGWTTYDRQIGQSGRRVAPHIYLAFGISGSVHHTVGIRGAGRVIAVNSDRWAPIREVADVLLVGDACDVAEELLRTAKKPDADGRTGFSGQRIEAPPLASDWNSAEEPLRVGVCVTRATLDDFGKLFGRGARWREVARDLRRITNPADAAALEEGLRLRDGLARSELVVLTMAGEHADGCLRYCLAAGADRVVRLWDGTLAEADSLVTARVLAAAIRREDLHVVLCGVVAKDGLGGGVPVQLSELLGWDLHRDVSSISVRPQDSWCQVSQRWSGALRARLRCRVPAVFTVRPGATALRYPKLRRRLDAEALPIEVRTPMELGLQPEQMEPQLDVVGIGGPKPRAPTLSGGELPARERWAHAVSAGAGSGSCRMVEGPPQVLARELLACLHMEGTQSWVLDQEESNAI